MATAKSVLRAYANTLLSPFGLEIRRRPKPSLGNDLLSDIITLGQKPPKVVFDVGGHFGETVSAFVHHFKDPQIFTFEPFPEAFAKLKSTVTSFPNVQAVNLALSNKTGGAEFVVNSNSFTNSLLANATEAEMFQPEGYIGEPQIITVQQTTLDHFCADNNITQIDLLKIDTQGAEMLVLEGGRRLLKENNISIIYCEINFVPLYRGQPSVTDIVDFLSQYNMFLVGLYNPVRSKDSRLGWCDALFCREDLLKSPIQ